MKKCTTCGVNKSREDFYKSKSYKDGLGYRCKECDGKARAKFREKHLDKEKARQKYRNIKCRYGLSKEEYDRLYERSGGACYSCGRVPANMQICVDHCHETGRVRGLLCTECNKGLGLIGDTIESVEKLLEYLKSEIH